MGKGRKERKRGEGVEGGKLMRKLVQQWSVGTLALASQALNELRGSSRKKIRLESGL